jgi:hypothetical protein
MYNFEKYSPIALFVYNRPDHLHITLEALKKNYHADESNLFIFSDGPKSNNDIQAVQNVRSIINHITGFKSIQITEQPKNIGLAASIQSGVEDVLRLFGRVIVIEDDIVTSPAFLSYMNQALNFFQDDQRIWHINGFTHPISIKSFGDIFFNRVMDCWGWATWSNRWQFYERNPNKLIKEMSLNQKLAFDLNGTNEFWPQVERNAIGEINTWAIFWYATIFLKHGLCVSPAKSYTQNIGFDGSGENCLDDGSSNKILASLNINTVVDFRQPVAENIVAVNRIRKFYMLKKNPLHRIISKLKNYFS